MSMEIEGLNQPNTNTLYAPYKFGGSNFRNPVNKTAIEDSWMSDYKPTSNDDVFTQVYYVPLDSVNKSVLKAEQILSGIKLTLEKDLLSKIYIDPNVDPNLERTHTRVWKQVAKLLFKNKDETDEEEMVTILPILNNSDLPEIEDETPEQSPFIDYAEIFSPTQVNKDTVPGYICFDQIFFAEKYDSRACRRFLQEYYSTISLATFSYVYQLRKLVDLLINELLNIKQSIITDFGGQYENESQQQIALQYDAWAKAAVHYSGRITKILQAQPEQLPSSEVDKITKKQAAQFQAFFAVRVNAVDSEINDIIQNLKRDLIDNSDIFYKRYIKPAIRMSKDISDPLEFDYITSQMQVETPFLAGELLVATNLLKGNFASVHADVLERLRIATTKIDAALMLINEKRRYANFISQLSSKAVDKQKILINVKNDVFSQFFRSAPIDNTRKGSLKSSHLDLDDIDSRKAHPQYLLKNGGKITGDIKVKREVKIDGVDLSDHRHSGSDGSAKISILDIDYTIASENLNNKIKKPISVSIEGFQPAIIPGGVPVISSTVLIETEDDAIGYEYEILYTEIES